MRKIVAPAEVNEAKSARPTRGVFSPHDFFSFLFLLLFWKK